MLQIVASLIDAARGIIYDRHMFIVQATGHHVYLPQDIAFPVLKKSDMISTDQIMKKVPPETSNQILPPKKSVEVIKHFFSFATNALSE
jgi:hypothetical protein